MSQPNLAVTGTAVQKKARGAQAIKNMLKPVVSAEDAWQLMEEKMASRFKSVREAFVKFDFECDGEISDKEMRMALAAMGLEMTNGEYKKLWRKFDTSGDGTISYAEFNNKIGSLIHPAGIMTMNRPETPKVKEWQRRAIARGLKKKVANLDDCFREVDSDGSGRISHPEFIQLLRKLGLTKVGYEDSFQMMQRARHPDNKTDEMTQVEFKESMMEYMRIPEDLLNEDVEGPKPPSLKEAEKMLEAKLYNKFGQVQKAFRQFDEDKSGELTYDEFRRALKGLNILLTDDQFYALVAKFDTSMDGAISYEEFNAYIGPLIHPEAKDNSRSMLELEKYGGMQDGMSFNKNAHNKYDINKRGLEYDHKIGEMVKVQHVGDQKDDEEVPEDDPQAGSSSSSPEPAAGSHQASGARAAPAASSTTRRQSAGVAGGSAHSSASASLARPAPRAYRSGSVATMDLDLGATEDKMRRVLGRSWVQVFSDVKRASTAAGNPGVSLEPEHFRDVMAEKGVPLTGKEVRALAARYQMPGSGHVDAERLLRDTFKSSGPAVRPGTAAPRVSPLKLGRPPAHGTTQARPTSAFVRPVANVPGSHRAAPQVHAATGKMLF